MPGPTVKPSVEEYAPFYKRYIELAPEGAILAHLAQQKDASLAWMEQVPTDKWDYRYEPNKWSLKEIWVHLMDTERVFTYRAMRISRKDATPLPGFDHNGFVPNSGASARSVASIHQEYDLLRQSTIQLFNNFSDEMWAQLGNASDHPISVRALAYLVAGHELHHINIMEERYLS